MNDKEKTLKELNDRLFQCALELKDIRDEKEDLKKEPVKNAHRITELEYREKAREEEMDQIRAEKEPYEPKLESSLHDRMYDFGQGVKDRLEDAGKVWETAQEKLGEAGKFIEGATAAAIVAGASVVGMAHENKDMRELANASRKLVETPYKRQEHPQPDHGPEKDLEKGDEKHTRPAELEKQMPEVLLTCYKTDYNEALYRTESYEQAADFATSKLVNQLELQKMPGEENANNKIENKLEKTAAMLEEQYGTKTKEVFQQIVAEQKEQQMQAEKLNTQDRER